MEVIERLNKVTIEVDLECWRSVRDTISYIEEAANLSLSDSDFCTSKVRVIKVMRVYGTLIEAGDVSSGLKSAKDFVEERMDDLVLPTSRVLKGIRGW